MHVHVWGFTALGSPRACRGLVAPSGAQEDPRHPDRPSGKALQVLTRLFLTHSRPIPSPSPSPSLPLPLSLSVTQGSPKNSPRRSRLTQSKSASPTSPRSPAKRHSPSPRRPAGPASPRRAAAPEEVMKAVAVLVSGRLAANLRLFGISSHHDSGDVAALLRACPVLDRALCVVWVPRLLPRHILTDIVASALLDVELDGTLRRIAASANNANAKRNIDAITNNHAEGLGADSTASAGGNTDADADAGVSAGVSAGAGADAALPSADGLVACITDVHVRLVAESAALREQALEVVQVGTVHLQHFLQCFREILSAQQVLCLCSAATNSPLPAVHGVPTLWPPSPQTPAPFFTACTRGSPLTLFENEA